jgi:hypothetical protein
MIFNYKGKEMEVPDNFIMMCGEHAEQRGMTLEEYIAEAFTMLETGWDANGSPTNETSCGGTPNGWVSNEEFERQTHEIYGDSMPDVEVFDKHIKKLKDGN